MSRPISAEPPIPVAKPGNIQGSFLVQSLDHILGFAVPIAGYYTWGGGTGEPMAIGYTFSGPFFGIYLGNITFQKIDPLTQANLQWKGTNAVNLTITNITTSAYVDLRVYLLWVIPLWGAKVKFNDLNVTAVVDFSEAYHRYPQISLDVDLKYLKFDWDFFIIGWIIKLFLPEEKLMGLVQDGIKGGIESLNQYLKNRESNNFLTTIMSDLAINTGFSKPFGIERENDLITFGIDGRMHNKTVQRYSNEITKLEAVRFPRSHSNQFFIHQSSVEAALRSVIRLFLPQSLEDPSFTQLIGIYIPELFTKYGSDGMFKIQADVADDFNVDFSLKHGISLTNVAVGITIFGKPKSYYSSYKEALKFSMTLNIVDIDVHIQDLVIYTHIGSAKVSNAFLTDSYIGDIVRNNWDQFFETLINFELNEVNVNHKQFDIKKLDSQIDLISGQIPNSTVSFNYQDQFMYIGFRFFNDN